MKKVLAAAALVCSLSMLPVGLLAQDRDREQNREHSNTQSYYDSAHKDRHEWNDNESSAWNRYREEHHVKQTEFAKARRKDQQAYWNWRHEHPDTH